MRYTAGVNDPGHATWSLYCRPVGCHSTVARVSGQGFFCTEDAGGPRGATEKTTTSPDEAPQPIIAPQQAARKAGYEQIGRQPPVVRRPQRRNHRDRQGDSLVRQRIGAKTERQRSPVQSRGMTTRRQWGPAPDPTGAGPHWRRVPTRGTERAASYQSNTTPPDRCAGAPRSPTQHHRQVPMARQGHPPSGESGEIFTQ